MLIPQLIDESEVLLRFVFLDSFKNKKISIDKIIDQDIFLDTRLVGISLQRLLYTSFEFCKIQAKSISNKIYVGFILFKKSDYLNACEEFRKIRNNFESELKFTPLDDEGLYIKNTSNINTTDKGNPSHSDIFYINPALLPEESKPNISLRIFSKILFRNNCRLILDENYNNDISNFNSLESYFA